MYHRLLQEREEDYLDVAKILVLNGSPHKSASTTMAVTNAFVKGMCEGGEYESEIINISDLNVTPCMGCLSCWARTEGECVIKNDDMPAVKKRIEEADIIIESYQDVKEEKERVKANILSLLKEKYGIEEEDFLSAELCVVPAGPARDYGFFFRYVQ